MDQLYQYMNKAFKFEEKGFLDAAIQLSKNCIQLFPEYKDEIEFEIAKMNYRNGKEEEALKEFLILYEKTGKSEICDLILEAYYYNQQKELDERYCRNCKQLEYYNYFYGEIGSSEIHYYPILVGEDTIWYYDNIEKKFDIVKRNKVIIKEPIDAVFIASNLLYLEDILLLEKMTKKIKPYMDKENPLLLVYKKVTWELLLQLLDLQRLIEFDRIVFYDNREQLETLFLRGIYFSGYIVGEFSDEIMEKVNNSNRKFIEEEKQYRIKAVEYYRENRKEIKKRIKEGKPRILFITSRYTTALQYHIRDCIEVAKGMGLETELIIEQNRLIDKNSDLEYIKTIAEFKPDIIWLLDHFRNEFGWMSELDEIVWVCWIQDILPNIFSEKMALKQKENDIVISIFYNWENFQKLGYNRKKTIPSPMVANHKIYRSYIMSEAEKKQYECDICFVCHGSDVDGFIKTIVESYKEEDKKIIQDLFQNYVDYVRKTNNIFIKLDEFFLYINIFTKKFYHFYFKPDACNELAEIMHTRLNSRLYREQLVNWLIDAGYTNIKLWGREWKNSKKYEPYAMGVAENGEVLSKILQSSKIVVGNNIVLSGTSRVAETLLSGAFYMSNYIPPEIDTCDIRKWLKEEEELIFFRDKTDFLNKIQFYLNNEEERVRMARIGQKRALEELTYQKFMQNSIKEIGNMF